MLVKVEAGSISVTVIKAEMSMDEAKHIVESMRNLQQKDGATKEFYDQLNSIIQQE